jgi:sulfonate transport system ATP-binding protein
VFQEHRLFPWLSVEKNIGLGLLNANGALDALTRAHLQLCLAAGCFTRP